MVSLTVRDQAVNLYACTFDIQTKVDPAVAVDPVSVNAVPRATSLHCDQAGALLLVDKQSVDRQEAVIVMQTLDNRQDGLAPTAPFTQLERQAVSLALETTDDSTLRQQSS